MVTKEAMITKDDILKRLEKFDLRNSPELLNIHVTPEYARASVLIPLFYKEGEWHVLLTVRSKNLRTHSGGVAFPGGRFDETDENEIYTALRESEEEIGLPPNDVEIVAVLPKSYVRPNIFVDVVVGIIPSEFVPEPNPNEVELVFSLRLARFLKDDVVSVKQEFEGKMICIYYINDNIAGQKVVTWGFTAILCILVSVVVLDSDRQIDHVDGTVYTKNDAFHPEKSYAYRVLINQISKL